MFNRKSRQIVIKQFKYFESKQVIWNIFIDTLISIGWLSKRKFLVGSVNLFKVNDTSISSKIIDFKEQNVLSILLSFKNKGDQQLHFNFFDLKNSCVIEMATKINLKNTLFNYSSHLSNIKNTFKSNIKDIDNLLRDNLAEKGFKPYF